MLLFILSLFPSRNKLRISSFYQLLTGKKTTSVLIFGFLNELLPAHNSLPELTQKTYQERLTELEKSGLIQIEENEVFLTSKGRERQKKLNVLYPDLHFERYGRNWEEAWRLVKFAIQVVSHLNAHQSEYLPTETSPFYTTRIKSWLAHSGRSKEQLADTFYHELSTCLGKLTKEQANLLANQFSGYEQIGLLPYQLIEPSEDETTVYLQQAQAVHAFFNQLQQFPDFLFSQLLLPILEQNYNQSMLITRQLFLQGYSLSEIMVRRHLKKGTITDHLVEWALFLDDFPFDQLISKETNQLLASQTTPVQTWRYQEVNKMGTLDYGEFRFYQIRALKGGRKDEFNS
ncbi:helix-turn-helix domain-containing protein [Candidatus Enterococcus courvalinii]|uniref:Helix-turn-helix domain-containing protein n=1 Tax=Candidatus Enterococcus courvalinii TaxID=2815329 RepID=A0ABS3I0Z0_9ENTE|nr:helix-turn-helix domain-containing protein [Enterococcus sp. MSG2901]MBO0481995.1 helix-turn-helix domain-containing protein [Enterococcus sp. MSG2901]